MKMSIVAMWAIPLMLAWTACGATAFSVTPYVQHPSTNAMSVIWFAKGGSGEAATLSWWRAGGVTQRQTVTGTWAAALTNNVASGSDSAVHGNQYKYRHRITGLEPGTAYTYVVQLAGGASYANTFRTAPGPDCIAGREMGKILGKLGKRDLGRELKTPLKRVSTGLEWD